MKTSYLVVFRTHFICFFFKLILALFPKWSSAQYSAVEWGTYFGDDSSGFTYADDELIDDIRIDNHEPENIYVVGRTRSAFGTDTLCATKSVTFGKGDIMVAKYSHCGELLWSSYLGNIKKTDYAYGLDLDYDSLGNTLVYVAGEMKTNGKKPQVILCDGGPDPFKKKPVGTWDGFIAKYDEHGNLLRWTYFGGKDTTSEKVDQILGVAISNHSVFVTGYTESSDLHLGALHFGDTLFSGQGEGFLAEFDSDLSILKYFTYIGGEGKDRCHGIKIFQPNTDSADIFIDGTTPSENDIHTGAGFDSTFAGNVDGFVGKFEDDDADGVWTKTWCTYLGGSAIERARDMDVDDQGNIILVGQTFSNDLPFATSYDTSYNGGTDGFVVKLPNSGGSPLWGTYFGGYAEEEAVGLVWKKGDSVDHVIIGGITYSSQKSTCLPDPNPHGYAVFPLVDPLQPFINTKTKTNYCPNMVGDVFVAELTDDTDNQTLVFSTYFGGKGNEVNGDDQLSYNPSFAINSTGKLYMAFNTISNDINTGLGSWFKVSFGSYHGGIEGYITKLTNDETDTCDALPRLFDIKGTSHSESKDIMVFPNPGSGYFIIRGNEHDQMPISGQVFDQLGTFISDFDFDLNSKTSAIDIGRYPAGIYILQLTFKDHISHTRLVKQQ